MSLDGTMDISAMLAQEDFNAAEYVNDYLRTAARPGDEMKRLNLLRQELKHREAEAAEAIKNTVFDHYRHFIDASKEISSLEREIYQLSTLLTEQKKLIESMQTETGTSVHEKGRGAGGSSSSMRSTTSSQQQLQEQQLSHQLQALTAKMSGVAGIVNSCLATGSNERLLLQGEFTLLDGDSMAPLHSVMLVLLSNSLLIGHPTPGGGRNAPSYQLASQHALDSLALVNVKDHSASASRSRFRHADSLPLGSDVDSPRGQQHVLQLLLFPDQLYVRCENARQKREWLEVVETAKKRQQQTESFVRQETIRARRRSILSSIAAKGQFLPSKEPRGSIGVGDTTSLREQDERSEEDGSKHAAANRVTSVEDTQWLNELIDELQDEISHRHLEQAVEMILEWKSCNCQHAGINAKFAALEKTVVQMLSDEVRRVAGGNFSTFAATTATSRTHTHGCLSSKAARQPLALLSSLDRATYAVDLYLKRRSAALRQCARELAVSEEPLSYVRHAALLFVGAMLDMVGEFTAHHHPTATTAGAGAVAAAATGGSPLFSSAEHYCLVLQWCSGEMSHLLGMVRRNVMESATSMAVLAHTWRILTSHCDRLARVGVDLGFEINRLLLPSLCTALERSFGNLADAVRLRIAEEKWHPTELESAAALTRCLGELADLGLSGLGWAIVGAGGSSRDGGSGSTTTKPHSLNIASSALQFARVAHSLARDFAALNDSSTGCPPHMHAVCDSYVRTLWCEYLFALTHTAAATTAQQSEVLEDTCRFIVAHVVPACDAIYTSDAAYAAVDKMPDAQHEPETAGLVDQLLEKFPALLKYREEDTADGVNGRRKASSFDEEIANV